MSNTKINTLILTWKPEINKEFKEPEFNALVSTSRNIGYVDARWRFLSKNFNPKDMVLVIRQGKETGLFGFGHILLNQSSKDSTLTTHYSTVRLMNLRSTHEHPFVSKEILIKIGIRKSILETQASGFVTLSNEEVASLQTHMISIYKKSLEKMCL
jgi:hypothetical protein